MDRRQLVRHCLVVTGPTIALSGVVVAGLANVPADRKDLIRRWDTPDRWLVWVTVGLAAAWLAWASPLAPLRRRIAADVVMAGACAVALAVIVVDVRGRAVDLSVPLTASRLALSLAGALVALAGRRDGRDRRLASAHRRCADDRCCHGVCAEPSRDLK